MRYQLYDRYEKKVVKTFASLGEAGLYLAQEVEHESRKEGLVTMPRFIIRY
jgi:hypothetical protein